MKKEKPALSIGGISGHLALPGDSKEFPEKIGHSTRVVKNPFPCAFPRRVRYHSLMITIRKERSEDISGIRKVIAQAFRMDDETDFVDVLRTRNVVTLSLVAAVDGQIAGHIMFTPVTVESNEGTFGAIGLAPLAVAPPFQNQGIGTRLVRAGLGELRSMGHAAVVVLGHPEYYSAFGFVPAVRYGMRYEGVVPDDVFMALELREGSLIGRSGIVKYEPEFGIAGLLEE